MKNNNIRFFNEEYHTLLSWKNAFNSSIINHSYCILFGFKPLAIHKKESVVTCEFNDAREAQSAYQSLNAHVCHFTKTLHGQKIVLHLHGHTEETRLALQKRIDSFIHQRKTQMQARRRLLLKQQPQHKTIIDDEIRFILQTIYIHI